MPSGWKRHALPIWCGLLTALIVLPLLRPGYVLNLDMVFVPHQTLLPWNLGIGGGLPRSVPQDAVVSLLAGPLPGQILQKAVLLGTFLLAGVGAGRLAAGDRVGQLAAASLYMWSAYVAARLLMGHWGLLWAFALLPWAVLAARRARATGSWPGMAALCGAGALVPTGGIVLAAAALPLGLGFGSRVPVRTRWVAGLLVLLFNAPWWLPAVRSPVVDVSDPVALSVFGSRADGPGGVVWSVLAGGGVWNAQATLGSRTTWFAVFVTAVLVVLTVIGWRRWRQTQHVEPIWLGILAVAGLAWAWISGVAGDQGWAQAVVTGVPGGGLLRDGQKWTVYWVLLVAVCAPAGLVHISRGAQRPLRVFLAAALAVLPLAALPDLSWGALGRLHAVSYPASWSSLRDEISAAAGRGDVVSLPWAPFRRYDWNGSRIVLDPLPRYLTRTVLWNDRLPVTVQGRLVQVGGDDPRAAAVGRAIDEGRPLGPVLAGLGVGWVVIQRDQPEATRPPDLSGTAPVWGEGSLELRRVIAQVRVQAPRDPVVVFADICALTVWAGVGAYAARRSVVRRSRRTSQG